MEIILALVVASAVIFFGALINIGNERQRKAIDGLRANFIQWAEQDLLIQREKLSLDIRVDDPLAWFSRLASRTLGVNLKLSFLQSGEDPTILMFNTEDISEHVIFTTLSPSDVRRIRRQTRLKPALDNPVLFLLHHNKAQKISITNGGFLYDLELPIAWKALKGYVPAQLENIWVYS